MEMIKDIDENFRKALEAEGFYQSTETHLFKKSLGNEKFLFLEIQNTFSGKAKKLFFYYFLLSDDEENFLQHNGDFVNEVFPQIKVTNAIIDRKFYYRCEYMTAICDAEELVPEIRVAYAFIQEAARHIYHIHPSRELHKSPDDRDEDEEKDNYETENQTFTEPF